MGDIALRDPLPIHSYSDGISYSRVMELCPECGVIVDGCFNCRGVVASVGSLG